MRPERPDERRRAERRARDRRRPERREAGRRQRERRGLVGAAGTTMLLGVIGLGAAASAEAQIYTRVNRNGVIEATDAPDASDFRLTYPGKGTLIHSRGFRRAYHGEFDRHIDAAAAAHSVSAGLVHAVIAVESEYDQMAVSSKGAQGIMQLMPFTARRFGVSDPFDARQNIFGGVQYLRFLLDLFQGDVALAVAAYNAGENAVLRYGGVPPYKETRSYVARVQSLLGGLAPLIPLPRLVSTASVGPTASRGKEGKERIKPARPRVYYKWTDEQGVLHVAHTPPGEGVVYTMIRALD